LTLRYCNVYNSFLLPLSKFALFNIELITIPQIDIDRIDDKQIWIRTRAWYFLY